MKEFGRRKVLSAGALAGVVTLFMAPAGVPAAEVTGRMCAAGGAPMAGGVVLFFRAEGNAPPPRPERYFRMPDLTAPLDGEGRFLVNLQEGRYYVGAMRRSGENKPGPIGDKDLFFTVDGGDGNPRAIEVPAEGRLDIGRHAGGRELAKVIAARSGRNETPPKSPPPSSPAPAWLETGIRGTVRDLDGVPAPGVWVWARSANPDAPTRLDSYISTLTPKDGSYSLRLPAGGDYQLSVGSSDASRRLVEPGPGGEHLSMPHYPFTVDDGRTAQDVDLTVR